MSQPIFVEVLDNQSRVIQRTRIQQLPITLGRGYHNDVILDDNYVAAEHARIETNQLGELLITDLNTKNGLYLNEKPVNFGIITGNEIYQLGRTQLRIRPESFRVTDELIDEDRHRRSYWPIAIGVLLLAALLDVAKFWLYSTEPATSTDYLTALIKTPVMSLVYASILALIGKLIYGHARFVQQLAITGLFVVAVALLASIGQLVAFSFNIPAIIDVVYFAGLLITFIGLYVQIRVMGNPHKLRLALILSIMAAALIGFMCVKSYQSSHYVTNNLYLNQILPDSIRASGARTPEAFVESLDAIKPSLDKLRKPKEIKEKSDQN